MTKTAKDQRVASLGSMEMDWWAISRGIRSQFDTKRYFN